MDPDGAHDRADEPVLLIERGLARALRRLEPRSELRELVDVVREPGDAGDVALAVLETVEDTRDLRVLTKLVRDADDGAHAGDRPRVVVGARGRGLELRAILGVGGDDAPQERLSEIAACVERAAVRELELRAAAGDRRSDLRLLLRETRVQLVKLTRRVEQQREVPEREPRRRSAQLCDGAEAAHEERGRGAEDVIGTVLRTPRDERLLGVRPEQHLFQQLHLVLRHRR